ncbi:AMP-binding protein [Deltaproteobacteria bacterium OttesenSCG-928-K17]|nr:AMP-binding protein [Deltaproteobacteria bacterium OttesenSCG-928-K17]
MTNILRNKTIGRLLEDNAAIWPDREALIYPAIEADGADIRYTWKQLNEEVDRLARGMMALGVKKGDRVAIWATNRPQWLNTMFAASKIGAVTITINTHYREAEIKYLLAQSEANYLFLMGGFRGYSYLEAIYGIAPEIRENGRRPGFHAPALPHLQALVYFGPEPQPGMYNYNEILGLADKSPLADFRALTESLAPDEVINMQYTSGTTGFPKGVMLTHQNIVTNGYWIGRHQGFTHQDRICLPVPLFHCFGLVLGTMAALNHGAAMVVLDIYSALDILENVDKERCTAIYGVPTMFISILDQKSFSGFSLKTLRTGIMAGSPCPIKTMVEVIERMNASEITICYGLTETSPVVAQTTATDSLIKRTETVGRPMPGVEIKVLEPETGRELPQGSIGEVAVRGYVTMKGYYNMPEATAEIIDEEGWLRTGDLGKFDQDGYLVITGRWKDMIIRAGENIYPQEVEEYLRHMPEVIDVQVVAVPSKLHGEELGCFLTTTPEGAGITAREVKAYLRPLISGYKIPRYVKVLEAFPMTGSGKIQKFKLRELAADLWTKNEK